MKYRMFCYRRSFSFKKLLLWLCLPIFFFLIWLSFGEREKKEAIVTEEAQAATEETAASPGNIRLLRTADHSIEELTVEDYVIGVVAAEMPSAFEGEALKAQAVIARTYALHKQTASGEPDPAHGDLCDDPGHCQAYYDEAQLRENWGASFDSNYQKITAAVKATAGMILTYEGAPAETYYHSTCGGKTASAAEVWGTDIPYLQSVTCRWDKDAPRYEETAKVALAQLPWLLGDGATPCIAVAEGETVKEIPVAVGETESGRVDSVSYAGLYFRAKEFREALTLNSTRFQLKVHDDMLEVTTVGFGHGVGLCQYGANGLAKKGKTYDKILAHYYKGADLTNLINTD